MKLSEATARLRPPQQHQINHALVVLDRHGSAAGRRFASNAEAEFRIPEAAWSAIFRPVLSVDLRISDAATADHVLVAFRKGLADCLKSAPGPLTVPSLVPIGEEILGLNPKAYGRLVSLTALTEAWSSPVISSMGRRITAPKQVVRDFITNLSTPSGLTSWGLSRTLASLPLGRYIMWSTFDEKTLDEDPFPDRPLKVSELAAVMGLDYDVLFPKTTPPTRSKAFCVILGYRFPSVVRPHVPTIAEAYAGTGRLNYYFEIYRHKVDATLGHYPRTMATPKAQDKHGAPEVVHSVVFADNLSMPIQVADFK